MSSDDSKADKKRSQQSNNSSKTLRDIEQKLIEEDIPTIERLINELKSQDEKIVTRIKRLLVRRGQYAIDNYIQALKTSSDQIYENIVDVLLELGEFSVNSLIQALDDPSEEIKNSAKSILTQIGKSAVTPLIQALDDPSEEIKNSAKSILTQIGKSAVTPLIQALDDPSEEIKNSAKSILTQIGKPAVEPLLELLLVAKTTTKHHIREMLINIGEPVIRPLMNTLREPHLSDTVAKEIEAIILEIGEVGVKTLIRGLNDPDPTIRENVEKLLLEIGEASTPLLLNVAKMKDKDKDRDVSTLAKNIIRKMGQTGIKPLLEQIQATKVTPEKNAKLIEAINLLGEISSSEETQIFLNSLNGSSEVEMNRRRSYQIISQSIKALLPLLQHTDDIEVQRSAIRALGQIGEPIVLDPLINLLDSPSWQIRADSRDVIARLKIGTPLSDEEKQELFLKGFPDFQKYPLIEDILRRYLKGSISSDKILGELGTVINMPEEDVFYHFNGMFLDTNVVLEKLIKILKDPPKPDIKITDSKKQQIIERYPDFQQFDVLEETFHQYAMKNYAYEQLISKLMETFNTSEEEDFFLFLNDIFPELNYVRENIVLLLGKFIDDRRIEYLLNIAEDINPRIRWIATWSLRNHINEKVLDFFANRIKNTSYEKHTRWMSVIGLGKVKDKETVDALLGGVKDPDEDIARWSSYALAKIGTPAVIPLIATLEEVAAVDSSENIKRTLVKLRKHAIKPLTQRLADAEGLFFEHISDILLEIGKSVVKPLIKSLNSPNKKFVENCMKVLTRFEKDACDDLIRALGLEDEKIQINAMKVLYNLVEVSIPSLIQALENKNKMVAKNAMKILYKMGDTSLSSLIDALEGASTNLKRVIITLLSEMSPKSIRPLIYALDETKEKAENAKIALSKIGENAIAKELLSISGGKEFSNFHKILEGEKEFRDLAFRIKRLRERAKRKISDENKKENG
ncbi:MAG: HEAT repeat domain-containing protein [Promethearchaeota archaeon]